MLAHGKQFSASNASDKTVCQRIKSKELPKVEFTATKQHNEIAFPKACSLCKVPILLQNHFKIFVNRSLYSKYMLDENRHFLKLTEAILSNSRCSVTIEYKDKLLYANSEKEHLKTFVKIDQARKKLRQLTKYYQYHENTPRLFMKTINDIMRRYYYEKKRYECQEIQNQSRGNNFLPNTKSAAENKNQNKDFGTEHHLQCRVENFKLGTPQVTKDIEKDLRLRNEDPNNEIRTNAEKYESISQNLSRKISQDSKPAINDLCDLSIEGSVRQQNSSFSDFFNEKILSQNNLPTSKNLQDITLRLEEILKSDSQSYKKLDEILSPSSFSTPKNQNSGFQSHMNIIDLIEKKDVQVEESVNCSFNGGDSYLNLKPCTRQKSNNFNPPFGLNQQTPEVCSNKTHKKLSVQKNYESLPKSHQEIDLPLREKSKNEPKVINEKKLLPRKKKVAFAKIKQQLITVSNIVNQLKDFMEKGMEESQQKFFMNTHNDANLLKASSHKRVESLKDTKLSAGYGLRNSKRLNSENFAQYSPNQKHQANFQSYPYYNRGEENTIERGYFKKTPKRQGHFRGQSMKITDFNFKSRPIHYRVRSEYNFKSYTKYGQPLPENSRHLHSHQFWDTPIQTSPTKNSHQRFSSARQVILKDHAGVEESWKNHPNKNFLSSKYLEFDKVSNGFFFQDRDLRFESEYHLPSQMYTISKYGIGGARPSSPGVFRHLRSATAVSPKNFFIPADISASHTGPFTDSPTIACRNYIENHNHGVFSSANLHRRNRSPFY